MSVSVSGMDSSRLLCGHPYGGCTILYRKSLINHVTMLNNYFDCFCAVKLQDSSSNVILKWVAHFWYKVCSETGCPSFDVFFQIKKNSKNRFKYEVKRFRRQELHIRRKNMPRLFSPPGLDTFGLKLIESTSVASSKNLSPLSIVTQVALPLPIISQINSTTYLTCITPFHQRVS